MTQATDKSKEIAYAILQEFDLNMLSKDFLRVMMTFLELDESKMPQKHMIAEKIMQIYQNYRGQYEMYLSQSKFKLLNSDVRDAVWTLFKQYDEKIKQRKFMSLNQPKTMLNREHLNQHMIPQSNQNMNMNMVNMFLQVPNFQTVQQIQIFQRKMFDIYKSFMPQVLNSISGQSRYYGNNPYQQYPMHNMSGITPMNNLGGMSNLGSMSGIPNMSNMGGMNSMPSMSGMGIPGLGNMNNMGTNGMNGMSGMSGMSGMNGMNGMGLGMNSMNYGKTDYYQPQTSYQNRSYFQNKPSQSVFNDLQSQNIHNPQKNIPNTNLFRQNPIMPQNIPGGSFNFYANSQHNDDYNRSAFKGMSLYSQNRPNQQSEQYERKNIYSQKFMNNDDQNVNNPYTQFNDFPLYAERPSLKNRQKQSRQSKQSRESKQVRQNLQLPINSQPRKMTKKDDEALLQSIESQSSKQPQIGSSHSLSHIISQSQNYNSCSCSLTEVCFYCKLLNIDPLNEVKEVLKIEKINPQKSEVIFMINKKILDKINENPDKLDIELRCIRIEKQYQNQISWPQKIRLLIDEDFDDQLSQSAKKKKDKSFIFSKNFGTEKNFQQSVKVVLKKSSEKVNSTGDYLYGIFLIEKHNVEKMYEKIMQNIKECSIVQFFKNPNIQNKQKIIVSIYDPVSKKLIKDPVRGKQCNHPQCFDLTFYLSILLISPNRQWKCPICSKDVKEFVLDFDLKKILSDSTKIKDSKQIAFYSSGKPEVQKQSEKQENKQRTTQLKMNEQQEKIKNQKQELAQKQHQ